MVRTYSTSKFLLQTISTSVDVLNKMKEGKILFPAIVVLVEIKVYVNTQYTCRSDVTCMWSKIALHWLI